MQHIGLHLEDEKGNLIERSKINFGDIINSLDEKSKSLYPWLWSIDPYGHTTFNLYQIPHVITELKQLSLELKNEELKLLINEATEFIAKTEQHIYTKLIGD
ncbi:MAG: hypothetical protein KW802_01280 [Candidatus Doudnabacteria bacterium]|nr:hypothetical protein [Candidatus Doudnabacteria bacterium]